MSKMRSRHLLLLPFVALVAFSAACGSGDDNAEGGGSGSESGSGGGQEALVLYSGRSSDLVTPLIEQFTEETGIQVEVREGSSAEMAAQLLTEGDASPADVYFSQDAGALGAVSKAGLFAPIAQEQLAQVPEAYRATDGTWVGTSGRVRVLVYNPEMVPEPPSTIDQLLEPQWKGKIGFAPSNASFQAFVTGLRVERGEEGAREWLEAFAAQEPVAYEENAAIRDAVDAGEIPLGLVNHYYLLEKIAEEGDENVTAQNQFMAPGDIGGLVNVAGVGVLATAQHPEQANELVAYLLGPKGQQYFAEETFEYPLVAGTAAAESLPALDELEPPQIDLSDLDSLEQTQELLAQVGLLTK
jgi:iron(III) transport system substrate-binding protein